MNEEIKRKIDQAIKNAKAWTKQEQMLLPKRIRWIMHNVVSYYYATIYHAIEDNLLLEAPDEDQLRMFLRMESRVRRVFEKSIRTWPDQWMMLNLWIACLHTTGDLFRSAIKQEFKAAKKARKV